MFTCSPVEIFVLEDVIDPEIKCAEVCQKYITRYTLIASHSYSCDHSLSIIIYNYKLTQHTSIRQSLLLELTCCGESQYVILTCLSR